MNSKKDYFNNVAHSRIKQRKAKSYYWNDITKYCNYFIQEDDSVLEIGCGTGELLNELIADEKVGIDFSSEMIAEANKQFPNLKLFVMPAEHINLTTKFDIIILSNLVGYLFDIQKVFSNLRVNCHSQTKIIVTYYNFLWEPILKLGEFIGYKTKTPIQNWLSLADINNLLYLSSFEVFRNSSRMILPIYFPILSKISNSFFANLPIFRKLCINHYSIAKPTSLSEKKTEYSVSIIIPACNESGNIENLVSRIPNLGTATEIIFIESNSTDNTWDKILEVQKKYSGNIVIEAFKTSSKNKGEAVKDGFEKSTGEILMILDADLSIAPEDLIKFYNAIVTGKGDFINGSRLIYPMEKEAMRFLNILANKFFSVLFTWLLNQRIKDTLCGTKALFRKDYLKINKNRSYFGDFDPFGDFDLLFGAHKLNLKITEIPVRYYERVYGRTNISRFKHGWLLLKMSFFAFRKIKFK